MSRRKPRRETYGDFDKIDDYFTRAVKELRGAITGLGALPEGYCWCFGHRRDADKTFDAHTGECRELKLALRKVEDLL